MLTSSKRPALAVSFAVAILMVFGFARLGASAQSSPAADAKSATDLAGTWLLAGTPDQPVEPPASGGRILFIGGGHWAITQADPQTGAVVYHHGGTYTLDGDQYVETVRYANPNTANLISKAHTFKVKVEGDKLTKTGVGNPWNEVWKRAK